MNIFVRDISCLRALVFVITRGVARLPKDQKKAFFRHEKKVADHLNYNAGDRKSNIDKLYKARCKYRKESKLQKLSKSKIFSIKNT